MIQLTCPMEQSRRQRCKRAQLRHRAPQAVRLSNPADSHAIPGAPTRSLFVPGGGAQGWRNCTRPGVDPVSASDLSTATLWVSGFGYRNCATRRPSCHREPFDKIVSRLNVSAEHPRQWLLCPVCGILSPCRAAWGTVWPRGGGHRPRDCGGTAAIFGDEGMPMDSVNSIALSALAGVIAALTATAIRGVASYIPPPRSATSGHQAPSTSLHSRERRRDAGGRTAYRFEHTKEFPQTPFVLHGTT